MAHQAAPIMRNEVKSVRNKTLRLSPTNDGALRRRRRGSARKSWDNVHKDKRTGACVDTDAAGGSALYVANASAVGPWRCTKVMTRLSCGSHVVRQVEAKSSSQVIWPNRSTTALDLYHPERFGGTCNLVDML
eukprot:6222200-Amphidinium_carterae.8